MADLFVTIVSIVPKPSDLTVGGPKGVGNPQSANGTFSGIPNQQVTTPGQSGK